jgi:shikimate dehydrogenase
LTREASARKRLAVIGHPILHSRSPQMHNAVLAALGLEDEWRYEAIEVGPDSFEERVREMPAESFVGANVTVPHKGAALAVADSLSEVAREIGAANTLTFEPGEIHADNTDGSGFIAALPASPGGSRALVLGAGGAARAVVWALGREGAEVEVWNRTGLRSQNLCAELGGTAVAEPVTSEYGLIVNTTAVGMRGEDPFAELPLDRQRFSDEQVVVDLVYGGGPSRLLRAAGERGASTVDGIEVLVRQGARSLQSWIGVEPPLEVMREAARGAC